MGKDGTQVNEKEHCCHRFQISPSHSPLAPWVGFDPEKAARSKPMADSPEGTCAVLSELPSLEHRIMGYLSDPRRVSHHHPLWNCFLEGPSW